MFLISQRVIECHERHEDGSSDEATSKRDPEAHAVVLEEVETGIRVDAGAFLSHNDVLLQFL